MTNAIMWTWPCGTTLCKISFSLAKFGNAITSRHWDARFIRLSYILVFTAASDPYWLICSQDCCNYLLNFSKWFVVIVVALLITRFQISLSKSLALMTTLCILQDAFSFQRNTRWYHISLSHVPWLILKYFCAASLQSQTISCLISILWAVMAWLVVVVAICSSTQRARRH